MSRKTEPQRPPKAESDAAETAPGAAPPTSEPAPVAEVGGPKGPDPTRFGDWSVNGRCIDF